MSVAQAVHRFMLLRFGGDLMVVRCREPFCWHRWWGRFPGPHGHYERRSEL